MKTLKLLPLSSGNNQEVTALTLAKVATPTPLEETDGALLEAEVALWTAADATITAVNAVAASLDNAGTKEVSLSPLRST